MPHNELVQSLLRGVDVIELVAQSERGLSLGEVCNALGLKQPTAHNLLRTLVSREFIEKTTSPVRYRLGPALTRLAEEWQGHQTIRRASAILTDLFERFRAHLPARLRPDDEASLSFSQHVGGEIVILLRLRLQRLGVLERPKLIMGAYRSASPLCFQAFWSREEVEEYRRRHPFADQGAALWGTQEALDAFLAESRQLGYVKPPMYPVEQFRAAVPVFGEGHQLVGALGAGIWLSAAPTDPMRLIAEMLDAAKQMEGVV